MKQKSTSALQKQPQITPITSPEWCNVIFNQTQTYDVDTVGKKGSNNKTILLNINVYFMTTR